MDKTELQELRDYLSSLTPGSIAGRHKLDVLLARCWDALEGAGQEGMTAKKLIGRVENPEWNPPELSFIIERHGQTVRGSTRASLHHWSVDVNSGVADCSSHSSYRQLTPRTKAVRTKPLAEELSSIILAGRDDVRLKWLRKPDLVQVNLPKSISTDMIDYKQTVQGRTRRLRKALIENMSKAGWHRVGTRGAVFEKAVKGE
jgi:hypothetical protein